MTKLLEKAFKAAARLPPKVQDILGTRILKEIEIFEDEARWAAAFARTQEQLGRWADEALAEIEAGEVEPLCFRKRR